MYWSCVRYCAACVVGEWREPPSAFMAECAALCMAFLADLMRVPGQPITFVTDYKAALDCAEGLASSGQLIVQGVMRSLLVLRRASSSGPVHVLHTHSHKGEYANELVDAASKLASRGGCVGATPFPDYDFWCDNRGQNLPWASRALQGSVVLPPVDGRDLAHDRSLRGLAAEEVLGPFMPTSLCPTWQQTTSAGTLAVRAASFNVLSLSGSAPRRNCTVREVGIALQVAKPFLLAESLQALNVAVKAFQETRCEQGAISCGGYLRFCSGSEGGLFGNELWFKLGHVLVLADGGMCWFLLMAADLVLERDDFCTRHADPSRLFVLYASAKTRVVFVSLHAPHRATKWPSGLWFRHGGKRLPVCVVKSLEVRLP